MHKFSKCKAVQKVLRNLILWPTEQPCLLVSCEEASVSHTAASLCTVLHSWDRLTKIALPWSCLLAERKSSFLGGNGILIVSLKFPQSREVFPRSVCLYCPTEWLYLGHVFTQCLLVYKHRKRLAKKCVKHVSFYLYVIRLPTTSPFNIHT